MSKASEYIKLGSLFLILLTVGVFYRKYEDKMDKETKERNDDAIRDYLLTDPDKLGAISVGKPILWIPIQYDHNARDWQSFGSRSSYDLNQPYIYLTVKSIIKYCKDSFHICLVDDKSYARLMPDWKYRDSMLSSPISDHARKLAIARLLRIYGGMTVPPSFLCMRNLKDMFDNGLQGGNTMFVCENINRTSTSSETDYVADTAVMGCKQQSAEMADLVKFIERSMASDHTNAMDFVGNTNVWCTAAVHQKRVNMVNSKLIGVRDKDGEKVQVEELMSNSYVAFAPHAYGVLVPANDLLSRPAYGWFVRLSGEQVLASNTLLGKYLLSANVPDDKNVLNPEDTEKPEWISYWHVPLEAPVWGVKPNYLGNNVLSSRSLK